MPPAAERQLTWAAPALASAASGADPLWRSLFYFNVYRLAGAVLLLVIASALGDTGPIGSRDSPLYVYITGLYCAFSLLCFVLIRIRWRFDLQLSTQVAADVAFIVMLIYASQGISSGLGLLLLTTLAAAGLVARGRLTLFYASLAAVGVLLEHTYEVLHFDAA